MGVKGLWRLIASCGTPVSLESLENKILAVDVSIWLHQAVRGFKGAGSGGGGNAHLLTLFHRICKLLFYRIHPVFVFDGGVPQLKRQTLSARRLRREVALNKAQRVRERLLTNLLRSQAVRNALGKKAPPPAAHYVPKPVKKNNDMFELPPLSEPLKLENTDSPKDNETKEDYIVKNLEQKNLHNFEYESTEFKSLPLEAQHEILFELQTTRKENSWDTINEMPQESNFFSSFQMDRLLKRRTFQKTLDDVRNDMQKRNAAEMEAKLFVDLEEHVSLTHRIISEDSSHSILIKKTNDQKDSGTLKENIIQQEKEALNSKTVKKQDFLTELAKQGIVMPSSNKQVKRDLELRDSDSEDSFSSEDESYSPSTKKLKMEEVDFLKAVDYVLDDDMLTQSEILSLIHQSQMEIEKESSTSGKSKQSNRNSGDLNQPSTSADAPGKLCEMEEESSTDDDDFIDVTDVETADTVESNDDNSAHNTPCAEISPTKGEGTNVEAILGAKTDSLYIKILQQRLDSIIQKSNEKSDVSKDSRKSNAQVSPRKNNAKDSPRKDSTHVSPEKNVKIILDFNKQKLPSGKDIFQDVFKSTVDRNLKIDNKTSSHSSINIPSSKCEATTMEASNCNDIVSSNSESKLHETLSLTKNLSPTNEDISLPKNLSLTNELKDKISELLKEEVNKIINKTIVNKSPVKENKKLIDTSPANSEPVNKPAININKKEESVPLKLPTSENLENNDTCMDNLTNIDSESEVESDEDVDISGSLGTNIHQGQNPPNVESKQESDKNKSLINKDHESSEDFDSAEELNSSDETLLSCEEENDTDMPHDFSTGKVAPLSKPKSPPLKYSVDELKNLQTKLTNEQAELISEVRSNERIGADLSHQVYGDAQELLQLFGLPYLVAPMEAEAQCAFLDEARLTHGTITDDSDIILFGGKILYKNMFNHSKHVECFKTETIKHNMALDRNQMIALALLTGSDYTIGIESVGSVLGMEILSEFPGKGINCLKNLKKWWSVASKSAAGIQSSKTKQKLALLHLPESFPNANIFQAYLHPEVDESKEKFSWKVPDVKKLQRFAADKFGWSQSKTNEIIGPVIKKLGIKDTQMRLDSYFTSIKLIKEPLNQSKRLQDAIARAKGEALVASSIIKNKPKTSKNTAIKNTGPSEGKTRVSKRRKTSREIESDKTESNKFSCEDENESTEDCSVLSKEEKREKFSKTF